MFRNFVVFSPVAMCCGCLAFADSNSKSLRPLLEASTPVAFNRPSTVDLYIDQAKVAFRCTEVAGDFLESGDRAIRFAPRARQEGSQGRVLHHPSIAMEGSATNGGPVKPHG
jgi:hypothetical protein